MTEAIQLNPGFYIYAIALGDVAIDYGPVGLRSFEVTSFSSEGLTAIVSKCPGHKIRPERRNLKAHHEVLKRLVADHAILPMGFGLCAPSEQSLCGLLSDNAEKLKKNLEAIEGCREWGVTVKLANGDPAQWILEVDPELEEKRNEILQSGHQMSRDDRMNFGQQIARQLEQQRAAYELEVRKSLESCCREVRTIDLKADAEICGFALLVEKENEAKLEEKISAMAAGLPEAFAVSFSGPWAAHNFVEVQMDASALEAQEGESS